MQFFKKTSNQKKGGEVHRYFQILSKQNKRRKFNENSEVFVVLLIKKLRTSEKNYLLFNLQFMEMCNKLAMNYEYHEEFITINYIVSLLVAI